MTESARPNTTSDGPPPGSLLGPGRILVAVDGSPASTDAVGLVAALPWRPGAAIRIVKAIDPGPGVVSGPWGAVAAAPQEDLEAALRQDAWETVESARALLVAPDRSVTAAVEVGRPATVIQDEAVALAADLVVIGSRGHGTIAAMLLGSVSAEVIDHAPAPVLVARRRHAAGEAPHVIRHAILAWDGSPSAEVAVEQVRTWPALASARIEVVTVADVGVSWWTGFAEVEAPGASVGNDALAASIDSSRAVASRLAEGLAATLRDAGLDAVATTRTGDAATELIAAAVDGQVDLIVMGTHGRTGLRRLALGSVAANVARHAPCSVLVARAVGGPAVAPEAPDG